jgi:hypothetical protein
VFTKKNSQLPANLRRLVREIERSPDWAFYRESLGNATQYTEWGAGASTVFSNHCDSKLLTTIESDPNFAAAILEINEVSKNARTGAHQMIVPDLGQTGAWGKPMDYSRRSQFPSYFWPISNLRDIRESDLFFIDGRFRVAVACSVIERGLPGSLVIIDDYQTRPEYHVIEELVDVFMVGGRQAAWYLPELNSSAREEARVMAQDFSLVFD